MAESKELARWLDVARNLIRNSGDLSALYPDPTAAATLALGGKQVRPRLLLMTAEALGVLGETAAILAAAVEVIHDASLFHDDVVDETALRRGEPTLHETDGNRLAIMAGDVCFARAMELVTRQDNLAVYRAVSRAVVDLASGQLAEAALRGGDGATAQRYFHVADRKTGALLALCFELPAYLAGCTDAEAERMRRAGVLLGRAFQVADDLLDLAADVEQTGKDTFNDLAEGKITYPYLLLMESGEEAAQLVRGSIGRPDPPRDAIRRAVAGAGVREAIERDLARWLDESASAIAGVVGADRSTDLLAFCRTLAFRSR